MGCTTSGIQRCTSKPLSKRGRNGGEGETEGGERGRCSEGSASESKRNALRAARKRERKRWRERKREKKRWRERERERERGRQTGRDRERNEGGRLES